MSGGGKTVREDRVAPQGATVREGGPSVGRGGPTVREGGATVREGRPAGGATVREGRPAARGGATVREGRPAARGGATVREGRPTDAEAAAPPRDDHAAGWLPPALAADYRLVEPLPARGAEADIYIVEPRRPPHDDAGSTRRVAKVYRQGIEPKEDVIRRVQAADPAHVVRLEAWGQDAGRWWELMEHAEHGSLRQLLEQEGPKLAEDLVLDILRELKDALDELHRLPLEHRDLKPANVLVRSRRPIELALTDFGISSVMQATVHFTETARTIRYAPPEAIGSVVSDEAERRSMVAIEHTTWDYWSLGMMLVEMLQGAHPYDGLSEAVISHRLATQRFDGLTEGVADPAWRKLCRGLLRRTPSDRWDAAAVSKWLADPNDPSLAVAQEARPAAAAPAARTIAFDGARYARPADLGAALSRDWAKAESFWKRRLTDLRTWLTDDLGLPELGDALAEIDAADLSLDVQVFSFIYHLAPDAPLRFRDVDLSVEGLAALAEGAASSGDADARTTLLALYRQRIPMLAASMPGGDAAAGVARRWDEAVGDHERLRSEMRARGVDVPGRDDDVLVTLLAASVPSLPVLAALRTAAHRASTPDARRCRWFRELGTPEDMPVAALPMLPHLQGPAERTARLARNAPVRGCVAGILIGGLFGLWVLFSDLLLFQGGAGLPVDSNQLLPWALALTLFAPLFAASLVVSVAWYRQGIRGIPDAVSVLVHRLRRAGRWLRSALPAVREALRPAARILASFLRPIVTIFLFFPWWIWLLGGLFLSPFLATAVIMVILLPAILLYAPVIPLSIVVTLPFVAVSRSVLFLVLFLVEINGVSERLFFPTYFISVVTLHALIGGAVGPLAPLLHRPCRNALQWMRAVVQRSRAVVAGFRPRSTAPAAGDRLWWVLVVLVWAFVLPVPLGLLAQGLLQLLELYIGVLNELAAVRADTN